MDGVALVVGEALVDVVERADGTTVERAGGSALNAAVALSRLVRPVLLATSFGPDARGRLITEHLAASEVPLARDPHVVAHTSVAHARIGVDGAATYDFDVTWELGPVAITNVHVLHVCSLAPLLDPGAAVVDELVDRLAPTTTISYDLNVRPAIIGVGPEVVKRVERMVARADLVKCSDEDLAALWPSYEEDEVVEHLQDLSGAPVVVTRGADGVTLALGSTAALYVGDPVQVVDTIGAGDTFGAALLDALWDRLPAGDLGQVSQEEWLTALAHASRCAAITVSRVGADPPWRHEL
ncbi:carbohydrate kinase [Nocardioides humilatus]|uniref:Carbohydrate kinase n=1 Tax=Nocardioides humilatus TaxID=2607660 RepID=A0A5B1LKP7_9ACTN|nr:PfkB family carbohydrate kinase [Nocardioides humilatus]KAA1421325.1 carbohydrate kinase [Nocardioides humilatus]